MGNVWPSSITSYAMKFSMIMSDFSTFTYMQSSLCSFIFLTLNNNEFLHLLLFWHLLSDSYKASVLKEWSYWNREGGIQSDSPPTYFFTCSRLVYVLIILWLTYFFLYYVCSEITGKRWFLQNKIAIRRVKCFWEGLRYFLSEGSKFESGLYASPTTDLCIFCIFLCYSVLPERK